MEEKEGYTAYVPRSASTQSLLDEIVEVLKLQQGPMDNIVSHPRSEKKRRKWKGFP